MDDLKNFGVVEMTDAESMLIDGGGRGFFYDVGYAIGKTAHVVWDAFTTVDGKDPYYAAKVG